MKQRISRRKGKVRLHRVRQPRQTLMFPDLPRVSDNSELTMKVDYLRARLNLILKDVDNWDIPEELLKTLTKKVYLYTAELERLLYQSNIQTIR